MKKSFFVAFFVFLAFPIMAKEPIKKWHFISNEEGEVIVEKQHSIKNDMDFWKPVKSAINKLSMENRTLVSEEIGSSITYDLQKKTRDETSIASGINYQESMSFRLTIRYENDQVVFHAESFNLIFKELGFDVWGKWIATTRSEPFAGLIDTYEAEKTKLESGALRGKEKKKTIEAIGSINESLNMCQLELDSILTAIENVLN